MYIDICMWNKVQEILTNQLMPMPVKVCIKKHDNNNNNDNDNLHMFIYKKNPDIFI